MRNFEIKTPLWGKLEAKLKFGVSRILFVGNLLLSAQILQLPTLLTYDAAVCSTKTISAQKWCTVTYYAAIHGAFVQFHALT